MTDLLTAEEAEQAIETRFQDGSYDRPQRMTRERVISFQGLAEAYRSDATVYAAVQPYVLGKRTWQGALLTAHRGLNDACCRHIAALHALGVHGPWPLIERETLDSVTNKHVLCALRLADHLFELHRRALLLADRRLSRHKVAL